MLAVQYALVFVSVIFDTTFETSPSVVRRLSCDPRVFDTGCTDLEHYAYQYQHDVI